MPDPSPATLSVLSSVSNWVLVAAAVLTVLGTIGSIWTSGIERRQSDIRIAGAEERAAQAGAVAAAATRDTARLNARAAELEKAAADARLETERLRVRLAWRRFDTDHVSSIIERLRTYQGQAFGLAVANEAEARALLHQVRAILDAAGWRRMPSRGGVHDAEGLAFLVSEIGVRIGFAPSRTADLQKVAASLAREFSAEGIWAVAQGYQELEDRPEVVEVVIGSKPPSE